MNFPWVEIWDRLENFDASRTDQALSFLMRELKRIAQADDAVWIGVVRMAHGKEAGRDHQLGWRGRVVVHLEWTDLKRRVVAGAMKAQEIDGGCRVPSKWRNEPENSARSRCASCTT